MTVKTPAARVVFPTLEKPTEQKSEGKYRASFRLGHCLLRKQRRAPRPNAVFRRWALDCASLQVLIHNLDHQDHLARVRLAEALTKNAQIMGELGQSAGKTSSIVDRFGRAIQGK